MLQIVHQTGALFHSLFKNTTRFSLKKLKYAVSSNKTTETDTRAEKDTCTCTTLTQAVKAWALNFT